MDVFLGSIILCGFGFAPRGFALCNGQLLPIGQNQALFALLGTTYGGDGHTTFALPDLQGRVPIHQGNGAGLSTYSLGDKAGAQSVTLTTNNLPSHTHSVNAVDAAPGGTSPAGALLAQSAVRGGAGAPLYSTNAATTQMAPGMIGPSGGSQPASILQPYLCISFCIALQGIFPSRN